MDLARISLSNAREPSNYTKAFLVGNAKHQLEMRSYSIYELQKSYGSHLRWE